MRKAAVESGELVRPTIEAGALATLSLYSASYWGFVLTGWPAKVEYPLHARELAKCHTDRYVTEQWGYKILQAFFVGTPSGKGVALLKFQHVKWSMFS
jgi:hypothetical protein